MLTLYAYPIHPNVHKIGLANGTIRITEEYYGIS